MPSTLTHQELATLFDYEPATGRLVWRKRAGDDRITKMWNTRFAGTEANHQITSGHHQAHVNKKSYLVHRIAWAIYYGEWPKGNIDHIDRNPANNAISNLRIASRSQNGTNSRVRANNTSGYKGVSWYTNQKKWIARITVDGKRWSIGYFDSAEDAGGAYAIAAQRFHGEFMGALR